MRFPKVWRIDRPAAESSVAPGASSMVSRALFREATAASEMSVGFAVIWPMLVATVAAEAPADIDAARDDAMLAIALVTAATAEESLELTDVTSIEADRETIAAAAAGPAAAELSTASTFAATIVV